MLGLIKFVASVAGVVSVAKNVANGEFGDAAKSAAIAAGVIAASNIIDQAQKTRVDESK